MISMNLAKNGCCLSSLQYSWTHIHLNENGRKSSDEVTWRRCTTWSQDEGEDTSLCLPLPAVCINVSCQGYTCDTCPHLRDSAEGCRLQNTPPELPWMDCRVKCSVCVITASCKVSSERWRWVQKMDMQGSLPYPFSSAHTSMCSQSLKRQVERALEKENI